MKQTLGEQKEVPCLTCGTVVQKKRHDQRFCGKKCAMKHHNSLAVWENRPDRVKLNIARMERYYATRDSKLESQRQWRKDNPDEAKKKDREQYLKYREKKIARTNAYRIAHPEIRRKEYRNKRTKQPWAQLLVNSRVRASQRNLPFALTREWAEKNWTGHCALSGLPFTLGTREHYPDSPSIDRIKPELGYTPDNCRFILFAVNSLRGNGTDEQMLRIARAICDYQLFPPKP